MKCSQTHDETFHFQTSKDNNFISWKKFKKIKKHILNIVEKMNKYVATKFPYILLNLIPYWFEKLFVYLNVCWH